jgi:hypothetical protein
LSSWTICGGVASSTTVPSKVVEKSRCQHVLACRVPVWHERLLQVHDGDDSGMKHSSIYIYIGTNHGLVVLRQVTPILSIRVLGHVLYSPCPTNQKTGSTTSSSFIGLAATWH